MSFKMIFCVWLIEISPELSRSEVENSTKQVAKTHITVKCCLLNSIGPELEIKY